ncbi:methyltransferase domain-containing protein [Sporosarcina thermotolerans]|uniref:methyltransferase domain-containing protein n=1 Tax=Sporosarcina thermotolerans TaxID=633404 RepID=UPI0024BC0990|nr:methyltransferase domain-containing protein [Sporosarcina thermotolerans]WHT48778.1 methyltransferase domain-containing protein [Sporosarcina thermotolerans]
MDRGSIEYIVGCMATYNGEKEIQRIQTGHRLKLVEFWNIRKGDRVLEIGCGQGDTTAALAYKVGNQGFVHGIDIAQADYGGPITLGEARNQLLDSDMGDRMKIEFGVDVLSDEIDFPPMSFDYIVFSHCAFYLRSEEELTVILSKVQKWGSSFALRNGIRGFKGSSNIHISKLFSFKHIMNASRKAVSQMCGHCSHLPIVCALQRTRVGRLHGSKSFNRRICRMDNGKLQ